MSGKLPSFESNALPVIPLMFRESAPYKRDYEDAVCRLIPDGNLRPAAIAVVRSSVEHRRAVAVDEREAMDSVVMEEYGRLFLTMDKDPSALPEDRIRQFATMARYLPSYEIFARLALEDEPDPASSVLAQLSFKLLVDAIGDRAVVESDDPEVILKVDGLFPDISPAMRASTQTPMFAIVSTKIDGLAVKDKGTHQVFEAKTRRKGVVDLGKVRSDATMTSFNLVANLHTLGSYVGDAVEVRKQKEAVAIHQQNVADYILQSGNYLPVIDRGYLTRFGSKAIADAYLVDPSDTNPQLVLDFEVGPEFLQSEA